MGNITNARSLASGVAFRCEDGAKAPTTLAEAIALTTASAAKNLGELSADGIKLAIATSRTSLKNMGGEDVYTITTEHTAKVEVTPLELLNASAIAEWAGTDKVSSDGNTVTIAQHDVERAMYVFLCALEGNRMAALVCPDAGMTKDSIEMAFNSSDAVKPTLEYTMYPDAEGVKGKIFFGSRA